MEGRPCCVFNGLPAFQLHIFLDIWDSSRETLWWMGVLSLTRWTRHWRKKPWRNHWISLPPPHKGWVAIALHPVLMTSARKHKHTRAHSQTQTKPTSWFQKGFSGLASVASWPRSCRGREGLEGYGAKNAPTRPTNRKCKQLVSAKIQSNLKGK